MLLILACNSNQDKTPIFSSVDKGPTILAPDNISTSEFHESLNSITADNKTIYFTRSDKQFKTSTLYQSQFVDSAWNAPQVLPFSGNHYDAGLSFSLNENYAFFTSKRPPNVDNLSQEWNIWKITFSQEDGWGKPEVLPAPINSDKLECCLTMNKDGTTFFSSNRTGNWDIYSAQFAQNKFGNVEKISDAVNSPAGEWPGYINESGDLLLFSSVRKTGHGGDDIYLTKKVENEWTKPVLFDLSINSASYEDNPLVSADGKYFFFSSWKDTEFSNGMSNIFYIETGKMDLEVDK